MRSIVAIRGIIILTVFLTACQSPIVLQSGNRDEKSFWFHYNIDRVLYVHDGDTFTVNYFITKNFEIHNETVRLLGCDAYELKDKSGLGVKARELTQDFLSTGTLSLWTRGERDGFGRLLATVQKGDKILNTVLNQAQLTTGKWHEDIILQLSENGKKYEQQ